MVALPEIADPAALAARVTAVADSTTCFRVKGFVAVAGKPMRLLAAGGRRAGDAPIRPAWNAAETRQGRLVVIGLKGLDRAAVTRTLLG